MTALTHPPCAKCVALMRSFVCTNPDCHWFEPLTAPTTTTQHDLPFNERVVEAVYYTTKTCAGYVVDHETVRPTWPNIESIRNIIWTSEELAGLLLTSHNSRRCNTRIPIINGSVPCQRAPHDDDIATQHTHAWFGGSKTPQITLVLRTSHK